MATRRQKENVLAVYTSEAEAIRHAVMLARELGRAVGILYRLIDGAEVYQIVNRGYEADGWQRCGVADPSTGYHAPSEAS